MPIIGALSWTPSGVVTATPPAQFLFRDPSGDLLSGHTIPQMLSHFDIWDDRSTFLAMFNVTKLGAQAPTDSWCGTATKTYEDGSPHHLFLAARATGTDTGRVVRAVVADITGGINPARPDLTLAAIRHMPIAPGHALALCDLKTGFIHEWLTAPTSPWPAGVTTTPNSPSMTASPWSPRASTWPQGEPKPPPSALTCASPRPRHGSNS